VRGVGRNRSQLQRRHSHPRRADARRSYKRAIVHRKNRFFRRQTCALQHRSGGRKPPVEKHLFRRPESHICNSVRRRNQERMACASRGERMESADGICMCAGRVPGRSDVPVEFSAGIPIIRPALAFPIRSGGRKFPRGMHSVRELETPKFSALHFQMRFVKPRRADAHRSCEPAFAHRKNRFLPTSVRNAIQERSA
jgi:hypothetical protein